MKFMSAFVCFQTEPFWWTLEFIKYYRSEHLSQVLEEAVWVPRCSHGMQKRYFLGHLCLMDMVD
jgi:hypothetical protein